MEILVKAGQLLLSLSILVIFHELGHFLFAKLFKTRVEKFYLFFNPWFSLFKIKRGETEYGVGWLPLGGYVKISGMIDESMDKEQMKQPPQPWEFRTKPGWQRLLIMVGGVAVNFVLAFFIYTMILTIWGKEYLPTDGLKHGIMVDSLGREIGLHNGDQIVSVGNKKVTEFNRIIPELLLNENKSFQVSRNGELVNIPVSPEMEKEIIRYKKPIISFRTPFTVGGFAKDSPAEKAGLQLKDRIIGINDSAIQFFDEFVLLIKPHKDQPVKIKVLRGGAEMEFNVHTTKEGLIGVERVVDFTEDVKLHNIEYSFPGAVAASIPLGYRTISDQIKQLKLIPKHADQLGGFIAIGGIFPSTWDWEKFWYLTAMLSIMLAVLNLLPIPALDGGHVMFLIFEMVTGKKPSEKFLEYAQIVGIVLLLGLLIFVNGNDIFKLIFK
jgi:regulator of sigma E protease